MDFNKQIEAISEELAKNEIPFTCGLDSHQYDVVKTKYITLSEKRIFEKVFDAIAINFHKIDLLSIKEHIVAAMKEKNDLVQILANVFDGVLDAFIHSPYIHLYLSKEAVAAFKQVRSSVVKDNVYSIKDGIYSSRGYTQMIMLNCPKVPVNILSKAERDKELDEQIALGFSPKSINWDENGVDNPHAHSYDANMELYLFLKYVMKFNVAFAGKITIEHSFWEKSLVCFITPMGEMKKHHVLPGTKKAKQLFNAILNESDTSEYSRVRFNMPAFYPSQDSCVVDSITSLAYLKGVFEKWIAQKFKVDYHCIQLEVVENKNLA